MNRDLDVFSIRQFNDVKLDLLVFPSAHDLKRLAIKWMVGTDDSDFLGIGLTMRSVISMRRQTWLRGVVNREVEGGYRPTAQLSRQPSWPFHSKLEIPYHVGRYFRL